MAGNQRPDSIFLQVWTLYHTCRQNGVWAKIVVETSGGEEEYTFSSRKQLYSETKRKPPSSPKPFTPSNKRKSPSKWRKDNVKWRAWLEKKLQETSVPSGPRGPLCEETPSEAQKETSVPIEPPVRKSPLRPWILRLYSRPVPLLHRGATTSYGHRGELYSQY